MRCLELVINGNKTNVRIMKADSFFSKLLGLMGKTNIEIGLLIPGCNSIHTFFMKIPIDTIFIGSDNKIVQIIHNLKPWRIVLPVSRAKDTLELESGSALNLCLKENDTLTFS